MKLFKLMVFILVVLPVVAHATPEGSAVNIIEVRPYISGVIFVTVDSTDFCETSVFKIGHDVAGKEEMYSALLSALMASKKVRLEALTSTGCNGWGTELQSIYLQAN